MAANERTFNDFRNLKKLWPYAKQDKKQFALAIFLIPIISVVQLSQPLILRHAIDEGVMQKDYLTLRFYAGIFLAFVVSEYLGRGLQSVTTTVAVERMIKRMRVKLCSHLLHMSLQFHHKNLSGILVTRTTSDFDNLSESLTEGTLQSLVDTVVLIGCLVGMISLHPVLGIITSLSLPFVFWLVTWFSKMIKNSLLEARKHLAQLNAYTQECLQGITTIKLLVAEKSSKTQYHALNENFRKAQMASVSFDAMLFSILDGISSITIGLILWLILSRLNWDKTLTAGVIVAFVRYTQQIFDPLKQLGQTIALLQGVFTSSNRIFGLLDQNELISGTRTLNSINGHIEFKNVSFSYPMTKSDQNEHSFQLKNINFSIKPGQSLALVGPTGSGKSTIIKLITKQYQGYDGHIQIDDQEINDLDPFLLRKKIAIVPQDVVLFRGSIAFNIGLNHPAVSQDSIRQAACLVGIDPFIQTLDKGYEFLVDEEGTNLSAGQKQLLVFARAIARNPDMVILDEASSALDPLSEKLVQSAIENIFLQKTAIVIAHRLSTIRHCHKILVIRKGMIAEEGTHDELLQLEGEYFKLSQSLL